MSVCLCVCMVCVGFFFSFSFILISCTMSFFFFFSAQRLFKLHLEDVLELGNAKFKVHVSSLREIIPDLCSVVLSAACMTE